MLQLKKKAISLNQDKKNSSTILSKNDTGLIIFDNEVHFHLRFYRLPEHFSNYQNAEVLYGKEGMQQVPDDGEGLLERRGGDKR